MIVYRQQGKGVDVFPLRNAISEFEDGEYMLLYKTKTPFYVLCNQTKHDCLDESEIPVVRSKHVNASQYSVMAFSAPTVFCHLGDSFTSNDSNTALIALKDAYRSLGYDSVLDQSSKQANDVVIGGKKVAAKAYGDGRISTFTGMSFNESMYENINLPDSKFDGKLSDTVSERIGLIDSHPPNEVIDAVESEMLSTFGMERKDGKVTQEMWQRMEEYKDEMISQEELTKV